MIDTVPDVASSPSTVGNFVIAYSCEADLVQNIQSEALLRFLDTERHSNTGILCNTDQAFFPRAFTDLDLIEQSSEVNGPLCVGEIKESYKSKNKASNTENSMAGENRFGVGSGFQPDVITSTSHQRSGPDGSPALVPSVSQGFVASSNLSETGELFAPVRTLTFSDIDQSSQIEDSYVNNSRLVSTPNKVERSAGNYDYSSMQSARFQRSEKVEAEYSDSSDSDNRINGIRDGESPEFRQLEGEADNDVLSTGPYHPSAHGLSKEFMDNFVGKTGNQSTTCDNNDIFSPLGSNSCNAVGRPIQSITPPLHSPGANSPYAKKYGSPRSKKSQRVERSPRGRLSPKGQAQPRDDPEEMQFVMSPTKTNPFDRELLGLGTQNDYQLQQKPVYHSRETFYYENNQGERSFEPIEKHPHNFNPAIVPKNLNEYFEQVTSDKFLLSRSRQNISTSYESEQFAMVSRQGDGTDNDLDERPQRLQSGANISTENPFSAVSPSAFEQKYLQRTQVSVKLPQATYDTMSANSSHDEKFASGDNSYHDNDTCRLDMPAEMSHFPPDVTSSGAEGGHVVEHSPKSSPGKVMDLLQNQVSKLKDNVEDVNDGSRDRREMKNTEEENVNCHISAKSKDTNGANLKKNHPVYVQQHNYDHPETVETPDNGEQIEVHVNEDSVVPPSQMSQSLVSSVTVGTKVQTDRSINVQQTQSLPTGSQSQNGSQYLSAGSQFLSADSESENGSLSQNGSQFLSAGSQSQTDSNLLPAGNQSQLPATSRLLQETVSQRNKTTQKFVSSAPSMSKSAASSQNKEFKKPFDVAPKNLAVASSGARKTLMSETGPKFKVSDKTRSMSSESLNQKQRIGQDQSRYVTNGNENVPQSRHNSQLGNQSVQTKGEIVARGEGHHGSMNSVEDEGQGHGRIVTQVEQTSPVPIEQPKQSIRSRQQGAGIGDSSLDIQGMEEVRQQLQGMMRMSYDQMSSDDRSHYEHSDIIAGFGVDFGDQHRPLENSWNMMRKPGEDDVMDNFPSFSSQYYTDSGNVSRSDTSIHAENHRLRDMLEKERYRRKHCEQYIQQLNVKLLETQQQVAVAVSTDKRKDIMIEQLDKQLARVMEGWKKRDQEKDAVLEEIEKEKEEIENSMRQQQEMISHFEQDMSAAVDALRQEKDTASKHADELKEKVQVSERSRGHAEELLEAEKEKVDLLQQECDNVREARENLDKKLDQMQRRLHREQDDWFQREQELLQRIDEVSEKSNKILQTERVKNEEQGKLAEEIMDQYQAANTAVKKLEMELDAALREKESIKVEMGIMEAKFENAQRVLEADMHSTMEKQIVEQISDVQRRHEAAQDATREKHREQVLQLSKRNGKEMEKQLATYREETVRKEDDYRKQLHELEARLMEYRNENAELKRSKQKLESTRLEILTKLQYAMQTQWNEALTLLTATPQRRQTQRRTSVIEDDAISVVSAPSVNFSLCTPNKPATNQNTPVKPPANQNSHMGSANPTIPPQKSTNQQSPSGSVANQLSPVLSQLPNHERALIFSPGGDSVMSHSTEKDAGEMAEDSIETAAMLHLKQFQEYMNSFTKTPEWISSINNQLEAASSPYMSQNPSTAAQSAPPRLPSPPELAALLTTHLHNIQQQKWMPHPLVSVNQSVTSHSQPNSILSNQRHPVNSETSSLPMNLNSVPTRSHGGASNVSQKIDNPSQNSANQNEVPKSSIAIEAMPTSYSGYNEKGAGMMWEGAAGMTRAVPLHSPQQGDDPYLNEEFQSMLAGLQGDQMRGYFQGGQSFSPPTKQNKESDSLEDLTNQSDRLNEDYSQLSERVEEHESHQHELQHYIQMLLNRSPGEVNTHDQNDSSLDQEELDLNDTAQAAQLQRELDRIQELRQKQEAASKQKNPADAGTEPTMEALSNTANDPVQNKILSQEQLTEVTKLLNQVKGQGHSQTSNPQVIELLEILKHSQLGKGNQSELRKGTRSVVSHKGAPVGIRRNVQFNPGKGIEAPKTPQDTSKVEKQAPRPTQNKKIERKVAGSATKPEKGSKLAAWK